MITGFTALLLFVAAPFATSRDAVSFDFGWKHRTGLHAWAKPNAWPPVHPDPGDKPAEAQLAYNDSDWLDVQLPHDGLIASAPTLLGCPGGCSGGSYIARHVLWYRKEFTLPASWSGSLIYLDFEGSFRETTVWLNGAKVAYHDCGYTPFRVRLDNTTNLKLGGSSSKNVISVFVDPDNGDSGGRDHGSGWWYEGGGLYRSVTLVRTDPLHIEQDGLFAYSNITWASGDDGTVVESAAGATTATLHAKAAISNGASTALNACAVLTLYAPDGTLAAPKLVSAVEAIPSGGSVTLMFNMSIAKPKLWSSATPNLYTLSATIHKPGGPSCDTSSPIVDVVNVTHGIRSLRYDADTGFFLNREHFKVRGFCDHNTFAIVGMAVPERINLFRAQASRAIGGNGRRTSHNPPATSMLQIYDRVGIVVMDENRLFANVTKYVHNMGALVKRDRNHPSVVIWSFCNEAGCEGMHEKGGPRFYDITYKYDGSRPTLANMFTFGDLLSNTIDVQGFSHQTRDKLEACHAKLPNKPIYMSECCSCNTFRDEDEGCETLHDNPHNLCIQKSFNARCTESNAATNASDGVDWATGTMVWTLFDYYGEPPVGGFEVSSSYGQFDLCGFPKAAAFWYRQQWLMGVDDSRGDKPFKTKGKSEVHLVESWESPDKFPQTKGTGKRSIHAYTAAPKAELLVNGKSIGVRSVTRMVDGPGSYAEWLDVPWEAGNLTAVARDDKGKAVATNTRVTNGPKASGLMLSLDAPSDLTGTGSALLNDGQDAALLRASVVDGSGRVMHLATNEITFKIVSGKGRIQGCHNGDPHSHLPNNAESYPAYHGLVRAVVRSTGVTGRARAERELLAKIDVSGPMAVAIEEEEGAEPIVVEASTPGLPSVKLSIPTSNEYKKEGVLAVAEAAAGKPVDFFGGGE